MNLKIKLKNKCDNKNGQHYLTKFAKVRKSFLYLQMMINQIILNYKIFIYWLNV